MEIPNEVRAVRQQFFQSSHEFPPPSGLTKAEVKVRLKELKNTLMIGITDVVTCFSFTASACTNFSYASSENLEGERERRGCGSRRLISSQLFGFADIRPSGYLYA